MAMELLRTPDECFTGLAALGECPWTAVYADLPFGAAQVRTAILDEGPRSAPVVLMLHGEPSWSFLYRKVMKVCLAAGLRCIAPDLIGFGRSDKPAVTSDYSYQRHMDWLHGLVDRLGLSAITLLAQDWGGLLGLRLVGERPELFRAVVAANTFLPTGDIAPPPAFFRWREFATTTPVFDIGRVLEKGCARPMSDDVRAAYAAPFPDERFKAGARAFPNLVPASPDDPASGPNRRAWQRLQSFAKPFVTAFGDSDPITRGADVMLQAMIPGAKGRAHRTLAGAGHFLQEDVGETLGEVVIETVALG
jgi:haloalkane dehalogenase